MPIYGGASGAAVKNFLRRTETFLTNSGTIASNSGTVATFGSAGLILDSGTFAANTATKWSKANTLGQRLGAESPLAGTVIVAAEIYYYTAGITAQQAAIVAGDVTYGHASAAGIGIAADLVFGFKVITSGAGAQNLYGFSCDGTTKVETFLQDISTYSTNGFNAQVMAIKTPTSIKYYVDRVLKYTQTTNIPPATANAISNVMSIAVHNGSGNSQTRIWVGALSLDRQLEP